MAHKFLYTKTSLQPYRKPFPEFTFTYNALLKVGLGLGIRFIKTTGMVDTGSQYCFLSPEWCPLLGLKDFKDTKYIQHIMGIGGKKTTNKAYFHDIKLVVFKDWRKPSLKDAWIIEAKVGILENPIAYPLILGNYGFLDHFSFTANIPSAYFELEHMFE